MAKMMNHRIEKLSMLLDTNETQLNVTNKNEISIKCDNPCPSRIKVNPGLMLKPKRFKVNSPIKEHTRESSKKTFTNSTQSIIHNRIPLKQKQFTCDQCPKTFSQKFNLLVHKRTHTGEKPYSCDICSMKFAKSQYLTHHKRIHTGEKPYHCSSCNMKFSDPSNLKRHKRIHT